MLALRAVHRSLNRIFRPFHPLFARIDGKLRPLVAWFLKYSPWQRLAIVAGVSAIVLIAIAAFTYASFVRDLGSKESIMARKSTGVVLLDRNGKQFFTLYEARSREYVPLSSVPEHLTQALVATEDKTFYTHEGFSGRGFTRALFQNLTSGEVVSGGSTLTQQLVKNTLLGEEQTLLRKYRELILAAEIERRYSKEDILEMYLNSVYYGEGAFGIASASRTYYSKPVSRLSLAESAMLVGILPAPSAYNPVSGDTAVAEARQELVLKNMVEQGYLSPETAAAAAQVRLSYADTSNRNGQSAHHFAYYVRDELIRRYGEQRVVRSGMQVRTTLDLEWQRAAENQVRTQLRRLSGQNASNAAVVAMAPQTGEIRAMVGSRDWSNPAFGQVNMTLTLRQPGSSIKPFIYAAGFAERSVTPSTTLHDVPTDFGGGYRPLNYDREFRGDVLPRRALANSLNIPAVEVLQKTGLDDGREMVERLGVKDFDKTQDTGLSFALGTTEVKLLEMTNAYATLANEGRYVEASSILEVKDKRGRSIFRYTPRAERRLDSGVAYIISSMLSDNRARTEEFGGALNVSRPAAVKTGTTENFRDAWTIGYTPDVVVGVWMGNNDNSPMQSIAGSLGPAPIWRGLIEGYSRGTQVKSFTQPSNVSSLLICSGSGYRANFENYPASFREYFLIGTEPRQTCNVPDPEEEERERKREEEKRKREEEKRKREEEKQQEEERQEEQKEDGGETIDPSITPRPSDPLTVPGNGNGRQSPGQGE